MAGYLQFRVEQLAFCLYFRAGHGANRSDNMNMVLQLFSIYQLVVDHSHAPDRYTQHY